MNGTDNKAPELSARVLERIKLKSQRRADHEAEREAERIKAAARADADKIRAAARTEADKIIAAAKAAQAKATAALKETKAKTDEAHAVYADISARVAGQEKRLKELNALLCPKALEAQYSKLTDPKMKAAFRKRYAVELGLSKR